MSLMVYILALGASCVHLQTYILCMTKHTEQIAIQVEHSAYSLIRPLVVALYLKHVRLQIP